MTNFTVTNNSDSGAGSLRQAILDANSVDSDDVIVFSTDLLGQTITLTSGQLEITDDLAIEGLGAGNLTISGGNNDFRVFKVDDGNDSNLLDVEMSGLTISDGQNTFTDNGGGIFNREKLEISNLTLRNNKGNFGGGIHNEGEITIENSSIRENHGTDGGGISNDGTMTISGTTISNNDRPIFGGGIRNTGTLTVLDSTISGNVAEEGKGGGIFNTGSLDLVNSTISGNSVESGFEDDAGGGIFNGGTLTVTNSTITNNVAPQGGGIVSNSLSGVTINNTIVAGNFDSNNSQGINPDVFGEFTTTRYNLIGDGTGSTGFTNGVDGRIYFY